MREAFLANGPKMLQYLATNSHVQFRTYKQSPDYSQELKGASAGGQAHEPMPFDARVLGNSFSKVRWPIPELMLFGRMMVTRAEAAQLLRSYKSAKSAFLGFKLVGRYLLDRINFKRGARLVLGNALIARLLHSLNELKVEVQLNQTVSTIVDSDGLVTGVEIVENNRRRRLRASRGVVLAGGGIPCELGMEGALFSAPHRSIHSCMSILRRRNHQPRARRRCTSGKDTGGKRIVVSELRRYATRRFNCSLPTHRS